MRGTSQTWEIDPHFLRWMLWAFQVLFPFRALIAWSWNFLSWVAQSHIPTPSTYSCFLFWLRYQNLLVTIFERLGSLFRHHLGSLRCSWYFLQSFWSVYPRDHAKIGAEAKYSSTIDSLGLASEMVIDYCWEGRHRSYSVVKERLVWLHILNYSLISWHYEVSLGDDAVRN